MILILDSHLFIASKLVMAHEAPAFTRLTGPPVTEGRFGALPIKMSLFIWVYLPSPNTAVLQEERWHGTNSRFVIPITDVNESLPVQETLYAGEPVSIPKGWPPPRPRGRLVAEGDGDGGDVDRVEAPLPGAEGPPATELPGEYSLFAGCLLICTGSIVTKHSRCTSFDPSRPPDCPRTDVTIRKQYGTVCKSTDYLCSSPSCATYVSHSLLSVPLFPQIKKKMGPIIFVGPILHLIVLMPSPVLGAVGPTAGDEPNCHS